MWASILLQQFVCQVSHVYTVYLGVEWLTIARIYLHTERIVHDTGQQH